MNKRVASSILALFFSRILTIKKCVFIQAMPFLKIKFAIFCFFFLLQTKNSAIKIQLLCTLTFLSKSGHTNLCYVFREFHGFYHFNKVFSYSRIEFLCFPKIPVFFAVSWVSIRKQWSTWFSYMVYLNIYNALRLYLMSGMNLNIFVFGKT